MDILYVLLLYTLHAHITITKTGQKKDIQTFIKYCLYRKMSMIVMLGLRPFTCKYAFKKFLEEPGIFWQLRYDGIAE